ncbi:MAG: hypothetical protein VCE43_16910, partial [Myxococcota bacterium]
MFCEALHSKCYLLARWSRFTSNLQLGNVAMLGEFGRARGARTQFRDWRIVTMTRYPTLCISALAIWLLFLAAQAVASPTSVEHTDDTNCDPLVVPQDVDELGTSPGFANLPAEFITVNLLTGPPPMVPCPAADDPNIPDAYISITNNTGQLFAQLWYVADPIESNDPAGPPGIGTSLSNFDGFVSQLVANEPFDGGRAFRIDKTGVNKPLMIESATQDEIFEVGETWSFVIQDYMNTPGNP